MAKDTVQRRLAAILAADVVGWSRLMGAEGREGLGGRGELSAIALSRYFCQTLGAELW